MHQTSKIPQQKTAHQTKKSVGKKAISPYISLVREARVKYRRRRLGALLVVAILALALYVGSSARAEAPPIYHTVESGETLWSITTDHYSPSEDPRPIIEEVRETNGLEDYRIHPGTTLQLPPI